MNKLQHPSPQSHKVHEVLQRVMMGCLRHPLTAFARETTRCGTSPPAAGVPPERTAYDRYVALAEVVVGWYFFPRVCGVQYHDIVYIVDSREVYAPADN